MTAAVATDTPTDTPTDTSPDTDPGTGAGAGAGDSPVGELVHVDPRVVLIGANVRADTRPDLKEFRRSIKERGVLEAITVYRDEEGRYVCLRGQRRTLTAAEVGTPTGTIPARVVAQPADADRIGDQMVENLHRAGMRESEVVAGVEQLALLGVSAAQITRRTALPRRDVNAALAVTGAGQTRARMEAGDLTLAEAAIFAEFEADESALERLEQRRRWGQPLEHEAQRLRDEAAEQAACDAEVERLRSEGLPVLSAHDIETAEEVLPISRLVTPDGTPLPEEDWPTVPGAALRLSTEWQYPDTQPDTDDDEDAHDHAADDDSDDESQDGDGDGGYVEPVQVYVTRWVVTDLAASGLRRRGPSPLGASGSDGSKESEEQAEARREERRRVIANNKAWTSAETVRREWLTGFLTRRAAPKGAEALICEALVTGQHTLRQAMEQRHPMLFRLLGIDTPPGHYYRAGDHECHTIATKATTPKAATMTTLAAVLAAWEASTGKHTWRSRSEWDTRVLTALTEWGYQPSDVESLLLGTPDEPDTQPDTDDGADDDSDPDDTGSTA